MKKNEEHAMEVTQGVRFEEFGLSEATLRAVRNKHYEISRSEEHTSELQSR